jgi:hypothetical protein
MGSLEVAAPQRQCHAIATIKKTSDAVTDYYMFYMQQDYIMECHKGKSWLILRLFNDPVYTARYIMSTEWTPDIFWRDWVNSRHLLERLSELQTSSGETEWTPDIFVFNTLWTAEIVQNWIKNAMMITNDEWATRCGRDFFKVRYYPWIQPVFLRKITNISVTIAVFPANIRTGDLSNMKQECEPTDVL